MGGHGGLQARDVTEDDGFEFLEPPLELIIFTPGNILLPVEMNGRWVMRIADI